MEKIDLVALMTSLTPCIIESSDMSTSEKISPAEIVLKAWPPSHSTEKINEFNRALVDVISRGDFVDISILLGSDAEEKDE